MIAVEVMSIENELEFRRRLSRVTPKVAPAIQAGIPLALVETNVLNPRAIMESPPGPAQLRWAVMASPVHPTDPAPITFESDPFAGATKVYTTLGGSKAYLCVASLASFSLPFFFDTDSNAQPVTVVANGSNTQMQLSIVVDGQTLNVCAGPSSGGFGWLYAHPTDSPVRLTTDYYAMDRELLESALHRQWPQLRLDYLGQGDSHFGIVSRKKATEMWAASGLSNFTWTPDVFDCEDFSYVYKAAVSRQQYADYAASGIKFAYAVGLIVGHSSGGAHAVNLFLDETFTAQIIEPQNGSIQTGSSWGYTPGAIWF